MVIIILSYLGVFKDFEFVVLFFCISLNKLSLNVLFTKEKNIYNLKTKESQIQRLNILGSSIEFEAIILNVKIN